MAAQAHTPETPCPEACSRKELLNSVEFQPERFGGLVTGWELILSSIVELSISLLPIFVETLVNNSLTVLSVEIFKMLGTTEFDSLFGITR